MNLSLLNEQVQEEVDQRQAEIIGSVFDSLTTRHQKKAQFSDCHCSYCVALRVYVHTKIKIRHLERRYDLTEHRKFYMDHHWAVQAAFDYATILPGLRRKKNAMKHTI